MLDDHLAALEAGQARIEESQRRAEAKIHFLCEVLDAKVGSALQVAHSPRSVSRSTHVSASPDSTPATPSGWDLGEGTGERVAPMLPKGWPRSLPLREVPQDTTGGCEASIPTSPTSADMTSLARKPTRSKLGARLGLDAYCRPVMDVLGAGFLLFDLAVVPYSLAWGASFGAEAPLAVVAACFWTCDVCLSLLGAQPGDDSEEEVSVRTSRTKYLRFWFWFDSTFALGDWALIAIRSLASSGGGGERSARLARMAKMVKLLSAMKVVRSAKLSKHLAEFVDSNASDRWSLIVQLLGISFLILSLSHVIACAWWALGASGWTDTQATWTHLVRTVGEEEASYLDTPAFYQYTTAFHFAMAQATLGSMEVSPTNSWERVFNILCLLVALLCGSTLISTLSAMMVDFHMARRGKVRSLRMLRRYLTEKKVSRALSLCIQRQACRRVREQNMLTADDVSVLSAISESLRNHLHREVCLPTLESYPLFRTLHLVDWVWFDRFLNDAVKMEVARPDDDIFLAGRLATSAYCISRGTVTYTQEATTSPVPGTRTTSAEGGCWLSECALWMQWIHVGTARAACFCELLVVDSQRFVDSFHGYHTVADLAAECGRIAHARVREARPPYDWWSTDLEAPCDFAGIVCAMARPTRILLGQVVSQRGHRQGGLGAFWETVGRLSSQGAVDSLMEQVAAGAFVLVPRSSGELEAVQHRVVFEVSDRRGRFFVHLGSWQGGRVQVSGQLPEARQQGGEGAAECVQRLQATALAPLLHSLTVNSAELLVERLGPRFGVDCRRVTHKVYATFSGSKVEAPFCLLPSEPEPTHVRRWFSWLSSDGKGAGVTSRNVFYSECGDDVVGEEGLEGDFFAWLLPEEMARFNEGDRESLAWARSLAPPEDRDDQGPHRRRGCAGAREGAADGGAARHGGRGGGVEPPPF